MRAWDLAPARFHQKAVFDWIASVTGRAKIYPPIYHTALITQDDGHRLEKRTQGVTLPELLAAGWNVAKLIACFKRGIDLEAESESAKTMPLSVLLKR